MNLDITHSLSLSLSLAICRSGKRQQLSFHFSLVVCCEEMRLRRHDGMQMFFDTTARTLKQMPSARYRHHHIIFNFYCAITTVSGWLASNITLSEWVYFDSIAERFVSVPFGSVRIGSQCFLFFNFISHLILTRSKQRAKPRYPCNREP